MKRWNEWIKNHTLLTQFGQSFITQILMCLALCWWLTARCSIGAWIFIPGFFFGLGGSFTVAYRLYLSVTECQKKEDKKKKRKISYNRHM